MLLFKPFLVILIVFCQFVAFQANARGLNSFKKKARGAKVSKAVLANKSALNLREIASFQEKYLGKKVVVFFKKNTSLKDRKSFTQLRKKKKLRLVQRFPKLGGLVLEIPSKRGLSFRKLEKVCKSLEKHSSIKFCVPDDSALPTELTGARGRELPSSRLSTAGETCSLFKEAEGIEYKGSSDFWAREMIGADLVDEEIMKMPQATLRLSLIHI